MKKTLFIWILLISIGTNAQHELKELKNLYPTLGYTPDISIDAAENFRLLKQTYLKIDSLIKGYPSYEEAKKHLTATQIEIYENEEEYSNEDHLYIGTWGCSWYCGGGPDSIFASSTLDSTPNFTYTADNAHDFSLRTAWVKGTAGDGIGESITFRFHQKSAPVTTVQIFNGYMKSPETWKNNSRVKRFKLYINDSAFAYLNLEDITTQQNFDIDTIYGQDQDIYLRFEVIAIYPGEKYQDVAVSEIEFDGFGVHCFAKGSLVSTADNLVKIEDLQAGDSILTFNLAQNKFETTPVISCAGSKHHNLYKITFETGSITVTDDHPLKLKNGYKSIKENNKYGISTSQLNIGDSIFYLNNSKKITFESVQKIEQIKACKTAYDIVLKNSQNETIYFINNVGVASENMETTVNRLSKKD